MNAPISSLLRLALVAVLALPLASAAVAQDRAERHAGHLDRLAQTLDLTEAQRALVADAAAEHGPGTRWALAAALAPTLTDAQKERLFTRPERPARTERPARADRLERADGTKREMKRERPDADARAERRDAMQEAMRSALALSEEQVKQLTALREARTAEREARREAANPQRRQERVQRRPAPGELPAEVAAILTPAQQEVFKVHRALGMQMHRAHRPMRSRSADR